MKFVVLALAVIGAASAVYIAPGYAGFGGYSAFGAPVVSPYAAAPVVSSYAASPVVSSYAAAPVISSYAAPGISAYGAAPIVPGFNSFGYSGYAAPAFGINAWKKRAAA